MDNSQFRSLIQKDQNAVAGDAAAPSRDFKKPALGSRSRASIPMTPRSLPGQSASKLFPQQVTDYRKEHDGPPPSKKIRTSAPKGTKFGAGYQDRTRARREGGEDAETQDDKQKRLQALEEMYKLQQIDEATFEDLKNQIGIGGDLNSTHLVKGLDWKLLQRIRRGEDLNNAPEPKQEPPRVDVDEELDHALEKEVEAVSHVSRKQEPTTEESEQPATRDEILRRLKESRSRPQLAAPAEPALGEHFKKVASDKSHKKKFIEVVNGRRREVLVVTNKDGTTKRKTRWLEKEEDVPKAAEIQPLGMEVPAEFLAKQQALLDQKAAEDEDDDIFQGAADYDPLAGINSDSDDEIIAKAEPATRLEKDGSSTSNKPRNYFGPNDQEEETKDRSKSILDNPMLLSALKRAAGLQRHEEIGGDGLDPSREAKQQQLLAKMKEQDRVDAADMDLTFGESRYGDEDDEAAPIWDGDDCEEGSTKKGVRKRGAKKRKGDKDNVSDVMAVLQGREKKAQSDKSKS